MGEDVDRVWLRLKMSYYGDDWIFLKMLIYHMMGRQLKFHLISPMIKNQITLVLFGNG